MDYPYWLIYIVDKKENNLILQSGWGRPSWRLASPDASQGWLPLKSRAAIPNYAGMNSRMDPWSKALSLTY
jgi:hypothetical protein